jgi:hypothetical protein
LSNGNLTILDVQLEPFAVAVNVIDNSTGLAVPFARVKVQNSNTDVEQVTDANGSLMLSAVSPGTYEITAGLWGYYSGCITITIGVPGTYTVSIEPGLFDDFTFDYGWVASSTAASGDWVREEPIGTFFSSVAANPEYDVTNDCSDRCFITGNGGGTANFDDVDDGTVTLASPVFDVTGYTDPYLNYSRWFFEQFSGNPSANDTMFVTVKNGTSATIVDVITGPSPTNSTWVNNSLRILDFISLSSNMKIEVSVSDKLGSGNPLEAGFDRFEITEGPTSVAELNSTSNGIMVFPNPFNEVVEIQVIDKNFTEKSFLVITDITGHEISRTTVNPLDKISLNTGDWSRGVYFVTLSNKNVTLVPQKITKL